MERAAIVTPMPEESSAALIALEKIKSAIKDKRRISLQAEDCKETIEMPESALVALDYALASVAAGEPFVIFSASDELTTQQAADLLNVSRPYVIGLLDAGEIEYRKVGKHRRIFASSLMRFMHEDNKRRRAAADSLTAELFEMGFAQ